MIKAGRRSGSLVRASRSASVPILTCCEFSVAPAITVDTTDNVGVGTAAPGYKLDVSGTVNATAFRGDGSQLTNLPGGGGGGSAALDKVTANTTVTNTTAETTLYSFSVPGGTLGTNNVLRLTIQITDLDVPNGASVTLRFKYGGTTLTSVDPLMRAVPE